MARKRRPGTLVPALEAWVPDLVDLLGCSPSAARDALRELVRVGLVAVEGGEVVLPLAPTQPHETQGDPHGV